MDADFKSWVLKRRIAQLGNKFDWDGFTSNPKVNLKLVQENMDKPWNWALFATCFLGDIVRGIPLSQYDIVTDVPVDFCIENGRNALKGKLIANEKFFAYHKAKGFTLRDVDIKHNRKVNIEHMIKYKTSQTDWYDFSSNHNCTFQIVLDYPDKNWDWQVLSEKIDFVHIKNHMNLPWIWSHVSNNNKVCIQDVIDMQHMPWEFKMLSKFINFDDILAHKDLFAWDWKFASWNLTLRLEHIINNSDLPWDWLALVEHKCVTFQDILKYDHLPWGSKGSFAVRYNINDNPNTTLEDMNHHPNFKWQSCFMWKKKAFDINWILRYPASLHFNKFPASRHSGIKWKDVQTYPHLPWCYRGLSVNYNVPIISILARTHLDWDWDEVCKRHDFLDPYNEHEARKYLAIKKICNQIYESFTNPAYLMCKKRLSKEFAGLE